MSDPGAEVALSLPASPQAASSARQAVRSLDRYLNGRLRELELLVTELVSNAVKHPDVPDNQISIWLCCRDGDLRAEVSDRGSGFVPPPPPEPGSERGSGWGLLLLDRLADRWGVQRAGKTTVWFELELHAGPNRAGLAATMAVAAARAAA